jgi:hypothetical protein
VQAGLRVTASIGVAARAPGESLDDVLARAGAAFHVFPEDLPPCS